MAVSFQHLCPHCGTVKIAFWVVSDWPVPTIGKDRFFAAKCANCSGGITGRAHHSSSTVFEMSKMIGNLNANGLRILEIWPNKVNNRVPEHIPVNIQNFYDQALSCLKSCSWDAAGMMFRKVLETATKALNPDGSASKLVKRIDEMHSKGMLTKDLASWAHEIRIEGNDAAHDEQPLLKEDAESLNDFCEYFLIYTFTLPKKIELRRNMEMDCQVSQ